MTDKIENLTTEHLRSMRDEIATLGNRIDAGFAAMQKENEQGFDDMRRRLTRVEHSILGLKRDETDTATELAEHRHTLDRLNLIIKELRERIDKLESRTAH